MLKIENYETLTNLTQKEITQDTDTTPKENYKGYDYYFIKTTPYYNTCLLVFANNNLIYIDEQMQYSKELTEDEAKQKMLSIAKNKLFTFDDFSNVETYIDYLNKLNFLNNIYGTLFNAISIYNTNLTPKQKKIVKQNFLAKNICFCYFEKLEDLERLNKLYQQLNTALIELLQTNKKAKEKAILYELNNYECFYSYELTDATLQLMNYGITQKEIANVFAKYKNKYGDY